MQVDCVSDCFMLLNKELALPNFEIADFSAAPIFDMQSGITIPLSGMTMPNTNF